MAAVQERWRHELQILIKNKKKEKKKNKEKI